MPYLIFHRMLLQPLQANQAQLAASKAREDRVRRGGTIELRYYSAALRPMAGRF